jgi:hypothetical protein
MGTGTWGGPSPFGGESVRVWVRRKRMVLGMALIGDKILLSIYSSLSIPREGGKGRYR